MTSISPKEELEMFEMNSFDPETALIVTNGKFNPPTKGHGAMIEHLFALAEEKKKEGFKPVVMIFTPPKNRYIENNTSFISSQTHIKTRKKTILSDEDRVNILENICKQINVNNYIFKVVPLNFMELKNKYMAKQKEGEIESLSIVVGSDRYPGNHNKSFVKYGRNRNNVTPTSEIAKQLRNNRGFDQGTQYSSSLFREFVKRYMENGNNINKNISKSILNNRISSNNKNRIFGQTLNRFDESKGLEERLKQTRNKKKRQRQKQGTQKAKRKKQNAKNKNYSLNDKYIN